MMSQNLERELLHAVADELGADLGVDVRYRSDLAIFWAKTWVRGRMEPVPKLWLSCESGALIVYDGSVSDDAFYESVELCDPAAISVLESRMRKWLERDALAERLKATDCKSVEGNLHAGSNPARIFGDTDG